MPTIDKRTDAMRPIPKNAGTTTAIKHGATWTRNGTGGHRDDTNLERTRAIWVEPDELEDQEPGWYIQTTDDDGNPIARTGPLDTLGIEYEIETIWKFGTANTRLTEAGEDAPPPIDETTERKLYEHGSEITRLGLDLRVHRTAVRWTEAIETATPKLARKGPGYTPPTVADALWESYERPGEIKEAYDRLVAAMNSRERWRNA